MAKLQKMRQLVPFGMNHDLDGIGRFPGLLHRPALGILSCLLRSRAFDLLLYGLARLLDILLQILSSKLRILLHALHHGIRQLVNLYRLCHQRRSFLQVNFSDFFRKFIWSIFTML